MAKKKNNSVPVFVFAALMILWGVEFFVFYENLSDAEEERDRLAQLEAEKSAHHEALKREAGLLQTYTGKMLSDPEFLEQEARERLNLGSEGEIVIRPEES